MYLDCPTLNVKNTLFNRSIIFNIHFVVLAWLISLMGGDLHSFSNLNRFFPHQIGYLQQNINGS